MKPFVDTGFLLTLLLQTGGSDTAWEIARSLGSPLSIASFQVFNLENRFQRQIEAAESPEADRAVAADALQNFRWYLDQQVLQPTRLDYDIAIDLATAWQKHNQTGATIPALLLLWPALAATIGATDFLSFDPRTRQLAAAAGLKLWPEKL
jgi:hypothetical protein